MRAEDGNEHKVHQRVLRHQLAVLLRQRLLEMVLEMHQHIIHLSHADLHHTNLHQIQERVERQPRLQQAVLRSARFRAHIRFRAETDVLRSVVQECRAQLLRGQCRRWCACVLRGEQVEGAGEGVAKKAECAAEEEADVAVAGVEVQRLAGERDVEAAADGAF